MKKVLLVTAAMLVVLALVWAAGCQRARSDAQVAADVQSKINSDQAIQSRQYSVTANNGVVTLSGNVGNDTERAAAANDAALVEGVKTVVNNLQVTPQPQQAVAQPPEPPAPAVEPAPAPRAARHAAAKPSGFTPGVRRSNSAPQDTTSYSPGGGMSSQSMAATSTPAPPPPPPKPADVTVPEGTTLTVRLIDPIDSDKNQPGDHFRATLDTPLTVGDTVAIPAGADVYGRVTNAKSAAHFAGRSEIALELTRINVNGKSYDLHTDQFARQGKARGKNTAEKVGGGAALGAIIGGIAGGGKGAAIGATIGAGAGGTAQAVTHGEQIRLTSEEALTFHLESPLTVAPSSRLDRNRQRQPLNYSDQ